MPHSCGLDDGLDDGSRDPLADAELTVLLGLAFQVVISKFVSRLDEAGYADLRPVHGMLFQALGGAGATGTELADRLGVTKQAAGQMVDYLADRGYVRREPHPDGGRRRLVVLTDTGREHLAVAGQVLHQLEGEVAQHLPGDDLGRLRTELAHVVRALAGNTPPPLRPVW